MATAADIALEFNNIILDSLPNLYAAKQGLIRKCRELNGKLSATQRAEFGEKLSLAIEQIPNEQLSPTGDWSVIDSLTHPIYDLLLSIKAP